jgi:hypothetical protein
MGMQSLTLCWIIPHPRILGDFLLAACKLILLKTSNEIKTCALFPHRTEEEMF